MVDYKLKIAQDEDALALLTTQVISQYINSSLSKRDRIQIALSGGSTPSKTYSLLREEQIPWQKVDVFLGDERWVSRLDESSNALMIRKTLLASGPGSKASFHATPTIECATPLDSAKQFSNLIENICTGSPPSFDLILLGLGEDGHTASLFPGTEALTIKNSLATVGVGKGQERITLTAEVINAAKKIIFLVSGKSKQIALKRLLDPNESFYRTPAKLIKPDSDVLILVDRDASALI